MNSNMLGQDLELDVPSRGGFQPLGYSVRVAGGPLFSTDSSSSFEPSTRSPRLCKKAVDLLLERLWPVTARELDKDFRAPDCQRLPDSSRSSQAFRDRII